MLMARLGMAVVMILLPPSARRGSQVLQALTSDQRASILCKLAALLYEREEDIIAANERDLESATELSAPLRSRLSLSSEKLASLAKGLHKLAGNNIYTIASYLVPTEQ